MRSPLAALLVLAFVLAACADSSTAPAASVSITTGSSFGECLGYCFQEVTFRGIFAFYVMRDSRTGQTRSGKTRLDLQESGELVQALDMEALQALPGVIGCPDCADGGAEWIEVEGEGGKQRVVFEYGSDLATIQPLLDAARTLRRNVLEGAAGGAAP